MTLGCILDFKYAFTTFAILAKFLKKKYWYYRGLISFINKKKGGGVSWSTFWPWSGN